MASKRVKAINSGYRSRYTRKSSKGLGIYALTPPGVGPNSTHLTARGATCFCAGCGRKS